MGASGVVPGHFRIPVCPAAENGHGGGGGASEFIRPGILSTWAKGQAALPDSKFPFPENVSLEIGVHRACGEAGIFVEKEAARIIVLNITDSTIDSGIFAAQVLALPKIDGVNFYRTDLDREATLEILKPYNDFKLVQPRFFYFENCRFLGLPSDFLPELVRTLLHFFDYGDAIQVNGDFSLVAKDCQVLPAGAMGHQIELNASLIRAKGELVFSLRPPRR